jgi:hydrogenase maturation protease
MSTLVVGVGSPFGDDTFGWRVVDRLAEMYQSAPARISDAIPLMHRARVPVDLLTWLNGVEHLIVCDACQGLGPAGQTVRWQWPAPQIQHLRPAGSHALGLASVLELAASLESLPAQVTLWLCEASSVASSAAARRAADEVAAAIATECLRTGLLSGERSGWVFGTWTSSSAREVSRSWALQTAPAAWAARCCTT